MLSFWIVRYFCGEPCLGWIIVLCVVVGALLTYMAYDLSRNVTIYELTEPGFAFKPLGRCRVTRKRLLVDMTKLRRYPEDDWCIEVRPGTAVRLKGSTLTVRTRQGDKPHRIDGLDPFNGYWFTVPLEDNGEG